jgi:HD-like signal output (HDOD) protein
LALQPTTRFDELKATNQLPSPTGVALALLRLAESEDTTTADIAHVLQSDPALSGRILKVANSAYSGRCRPATSVREAVTQLGIRLTRNIALIFARGPAQQGRVPYIRLRLLLVALAGHRSRRTGRQRAADA